MPDPFQNFIKSLSGDSVVEDKQDKQEPTDTQPPIPFIGPIDVPRTPMQQFGDTLYNTIPQRVREEREFEIAEEKKQAREMFDEQLASEHGLRKKLVESMARGARKREKVRDGIPVNPPPVSKAGMFNWNEAHRMVLREAKAVEESPTLKERRKAIVDYGEAIYRLNTDEDFWRNWLDLERDDAWTPEIRKIYGDYGNSEILKSANRRFQKWAATGDVDDPVPEREAWLAEFNKNYKAKAKSKTEAYEIINALAAKGEGNLAAINSPAETKRRWKDAAHMAVSSIAWPHHLQKAGEFSGALLGEVYTAAHEGGRYSGKFTDAALASRGYGQGPTAAEMLQAQGINSGSFGAFTAGEFLPDILASMAVSPAVAAFMRSSKVSGTAASLVARNPDMAGIAGRQVSAASFGGVIGGKTLGITSNPMDTINAGLMGAVIPGVHHFGSQAAGKIFARLIEKYPSKAAIMRSEIAIAEEAAGLGGVMALVEGPHFVKEWRSANEQERKDLAKRTLGTIWAFALPSIPMGAVKAARGHTAAEMEVMDRYVRSPEYLDALDQQRMRNVIVESLKESDVVMDAIIKTLNDSLDSHKPISPKEAEAIYRRGLDELTPEQREVYEGSVEARELPAEVKGAADVLGRLESKEIRSESPDALAESIRKSDEKIVQEKEHWEGVSKRVRELEKELIGRDRLEEKPDAPERDIEAEVEERVQSNLDKIETQLRGDEKITKAAEEAKTKKEKPDEVIINEYADVIRKIDSGYEYKGSDGAEALGKYKEDFLAQEGNTAEMWDHIAELARGEKRPAVEPELTESWQTTHEATGVKNWMGKGIFDRYLGEGKITANPDGSYTFESGRKGRWIKSGKVDAEGNTLELLEIKPRAEEAAAEPPATKAVRDEAKIEEAAKEVKSEKPTADEVVRGEAEARGEKLEVEGPPIPTEPIEPPPTGVESVVTGGVKRILRTISRRESDRLMAEGDAMTAMKILDSPESYYEVIPSSRISKSLDGLTMAELYGLLEDAQMGGASRKILPLIMVKRVARLSELHRQLEREGASKEKVDLAREQYLQAEKATAKFGTEHGQFIEQLKHLKKLPEVKANLADAAFEEAGAPRMTEAERRAFIEREEGLDRADKKLELANERARVEQSKEAIDAAIKAKEDYEGGLLEQAAFIGKRNPSSITDFVVSLLQGKLLTPATIFLNPAGNIFPLPLRASTRVFTRVMQEADAYMNEGRYKEEILRLEEELRGVEKESPREKEIVDRLGVLQARTDPMRRTRLSPIRGTIDKFKGLVKGLGIPRLLEAIKAPKGQRWEAFKRPTHDDALSSILLGNKLNEYEAGSDVKQVRPLNFVEAWGRFIDGVKGKDSSYSMAKAARDLAEAIMGVDADMMFRLLASGDLPFRHAEHFRVIREYGINRGLNEQQIKLAQLYPEAFFSEKEVKTMWNEASKATFQNENVFTKSLNRFNIWMNRGAIGKSAYLIYRGYTPYQKTLANISGEFAGFTPLGLTDYIYKAKTEGYNSREASLSLGRVTTGMAAYTLANYLIDKKLITADMNPFMSIDESAKIRFMTDAAFPHGHINLTGTLRSWEGGTAAYKDGDTVVDLRRMGGIGHLLLSNAKLRFKLEKMGPEERKKIEDSWLLMSREHLGAMAVNTAGQTLHQSFAQGARDLFRGVVTMAQEWDKPPSKRAGVLSVLRPLAKSAPSLVLPNTLDWFYKVGSPYRQSFKEDSFMKEFQATVQRRLSVIPFLGVDRPDNLPLVDMWGSDVLQYARGAEQSTMSERLIRATFLGAIGDPRKLSRRRDGGVWIHDPASSEVYRLWRKFRDGKIAPSMPSRFITVGEGDEKKTYKLNPEQYYYYSKSVGQFRYAGGSGEIVQVGLGEVKRKLEWGISSLVAMPAYEESSDRDKANVIIAINRKGIRMGKMKLLEKYPTSKLEVVPNPSGAMEDIVD